MFSTNALILHRSIGFGPLLDVLTMYLYLILGVSDTEGEIKHHLLPAKTVTSLCTDLEG